MTRLDFNCFCGNWPFFRVRSNTVEKVAQLHSRCGITGGFMSSLEAIFYQDPYEAELQLAQQLKGTSYMHAMTINPTLPAWKDDLKRAVRDLNIKAVRIVPGFHFYKLTDPVMDELSDMLRQYGLPLIITLRLRDERTMYMIQPEPVVIGDLCAYLDRNPDIVTLVAHIRAGEVPKLEAQLSARENLFIDISGFKDGLFTVDNAWENTAARGHIVYGSGAPLMEMQSTTMQIDTAHLEESAKNEMFSGEKLLALLHQTV